MKKLLNAITGLYIKALRKNEFESIKLRNIFLEKYLISVDLYSYGCFDPVRIPKNTKIGRYCSFANTAYIFNGNHGTTFLTTHPYLYNINLALVNEETIERTACTIEDDVWVGHNSIILPTVSRVGRGAVIGAGAVVTKNVPPYAIVGGNPAKIIKFRFTPEIIKKIEETEWWLKDKKWLESRMKTSPELLFDPGSFVLNKYNI